MSVDTAAGRVAAHAGPVMSAAVDYQAPFVIEKLVKDHIAADANEAAELFREAMRYLVLAESDRTIVWKMYSMRVDEAWHQFILFTAKYTEFCVEYFGRYLHHSPSNAPKGAGTEITPESTFPQFCRRYEQLYGVPLPELWYDDRTVTLKRRLYNDHAGRLTLADDGDMIDVLDPCGDVVFGASAVARDALAFIAGSGVFYVRELPGELTDVEKVGLAKALLECKVLRVGC